MKQQKKHDKLDKSIRVVFYAFGAFFLGAISLSGATALEHYITKGPAWKYYVGSLLFGAAVWWIHDQLSNPDESEV